ncbi:MAG: hypothetical protein OXI81_18565 [Paracoccaceae bacterium]|nr:hypothetical protein [Paracoccaceae bacterium]
MPPEPFDDVFIAMVRDLDRKGALRRMRRLRDRTLIALDGTQTFSSTMIKCGNRSTGTRREVLTDVYDKPRPVPGPRSAQPIHGRGRGRHAGGKFA